MKIGEPAHPTPTTRVLIWVGFLLGSIWAIQAVRELYPRDPYPGLIAISSLQLLIGEVLRRRWYRDELSLTDTRGTGIALLVLLGIQAIETLVTVRGGGPRGGWTVTMTELPRLLFLIGLTEEIWFRGLWRSMFGGGLGVGVILGSVVFGVYHAPQGPNAILMTTMVGLVFAAARHGGAGLVPLAMAHGLSDWATQRLVPGIRFRWGPDAVHTLLPVMCFLLTVGLLTRYPPGNGDPNE